MYYISIKVDQTSVHWCMSVIREKIRDVLTINFIKPCNHIGSNARAKHYVGSMWESDSFVQISWIT